MSKPKVCLLSYVVNQIYVVCNQKLHIYGYCTDKMDELPQKIKTFAFSFKIKEIMLIETTVLLVFL